MAKSKPKTKRQSAERKLTNSEVKNYTTKDAPSKNENALLEGVTSEDALDGWEKLRKFLIGLGADQAIYSSNRSVMFKRKQLYAFVTPRPKAIELFVITDRTIEHNLIKNFQSTKTRTTHQIKITHPDIIDEPITDWLREAFDVNGPKE